MVISPVFSKSDEGHFVVVIDAGHGGKDVGATENGVMEKNINLEVAKQLESLIKKKMKNTDVVMTRTDDSYLTLQQRADKANKSKGDIFISIHTNSVSKKNKNRSILEGSSVYTLGLHKDENNLDVAMRENSVIELEKDYEQKYSGFDPQRDESYIIFEMVQKKNLSQSIHLADHIEKELESAGRTNRGVHQAGFWVLWATSMPSVLIELDFICNPESAKYMSSNKGVKELADAIFKAVQKYELAWNKGISRPVTTDLANTYVENSESPLEDTFTEISEGQVAKPRTRIYREPTQFKKSTERKRRSEAGKILSLNNVYEKDNLSYPEKKVYSTAFESKEIKEPVLASAVSKDSGKKKKADKKKVKEPKKVTPKETKTRKDDAHNAKVNKLVTVYKIQVLASKDLLKPGNARFCGLTPISTFKENNLYKYYYGESTDRSELEAMLADVRKKIPDAFIVSSTKSMQSNK